MAINMADLMDSIRKWRSKNVASYWVQVDYIGNALHRMGLHTLTYTDGKLLHQWHDSWREIKTGSDFWLYSVPGAFALAREALMMAASAPPSDGDPVDVRFDSEYGYIKYLRVKMPERDAGNFTFEVKSFGEGVHPEFKG